MTLVVHVERVVLTGAGARQVDKRALAAQLPTAIAAALRASPAVVPATPPAPAAPPAPAEGPTGRVATAVGEAVTAALRGSG